MLYDFHIQFEIDDIDLLKSTIGAKRYRTAAIY